MKVFLHSPIAMLSFMIFSSFATTLHCQELPLRLGFSTDGTLQTHLPVELSKKDIAVMVSQAQHGVLASKHELVGIASWYGSKFQGRETANGERFDTNTLTAAHKTLPFGSIVAVTNTENKKTVEVRINDRGPFVENRIIDLSRAAASALDFTHKGIASVSVRILKLPPKARFVTLQISAFSDKSNAHALQTELGAKGVNTDILQSTDKKIYRVSIAKLPTEELETTKILLARIGYSNSLIKPYTEQ